MNSFYRNHYETDWGVNILSEFVFCRNYNNPRQVLVTLYKLKLILLRSLSLRMFSKINLVFIPAANGVD